MWMGTSKNQFLSSELVSSTCHVIKTRRAVSCGFLVQEIFRTFALDFHFHHFLNSCLDLPCLKVELFACQLASLQVVVDRSDVTRTILVSWCYHGLEGKCQWRRRIWQGCIDRWSPSWSNQEETIPTGHSTVIQQVQATLPYA